MVYCYYPSESKLALDGNSKIAIAKKKKKMKGRMERNVRESKGKMVKRGKLLLF